MPSKVFANNMGLSHKRSGGLSSVFPDVCKTPSPGGPVPVPYPNVGRSADVRKGSKKVKIQGASTMLNPRSISWVKRYGPDFVGDPAEAKKRALRSVAKWRSSIETAE